MLDRKRFALQWLVSAVFRLLYKLMAWHWRGSKSAWISAWHEPDLAIRLVFLGVGFVVTCVLVPIIFRDLGLIRGVSYFFAVYLAFSNATFFRIVKVGRDRYIPLGLVAPIFILVGVVGSGAIRPLIGDAKNAALAGDFVGAAVILGVFAVMTLLFRLWQSGNPYRS